MTDLRFKTTGRFVLSAAVAALAAFAITQDRTVALDAHELDTASISAGSAPVGRSTNLGNTHRNPATKGFGFGKVKNLYTFGAPQLQDPIGQVLDPIICEGNVTQGGWGRTGEFDPFPVSTAVIAAGKVSFGGSAQTTANNVRGGQEQYSDHNGVDAFTFHSTLITDVFCFDNPGDDDGVHATIMGQGRVTKLADFQDSIVNFTLDLDDRGEPGAGRDQYEIDLIGFPFLYSSGPIVLQGGNVTIRQ